MREYLKNWNFTRVMRLIVAIGFGYHAIITSNYILLVFSGILLVLTLLNVSFCGAGGCARPTDSKQGEVYNKDIKDFKG